MYNPKKKTVSLMFIVCAGAILQESIFTPKKSGVCYYAECITQNTYVKM